MKKRLIVIFVILVALMIAIVPASAEGDDTLLVLFNGKGVPAGFADQIAALGGEVTYSHEIGFAVVKGVSSQAVRKLSKVSEVMSNFHVKLEPGIISDAVEADALPMSPSDPSTALVFYSQWNMRAIDADDAWAAGYLGSSDVTVAILDTGIDYTYPDLVGLVDLDRSVSFIPEDDALVDAYFPGAHHIADLYFHGTHVAATVASNAYIAAGVTSQTTLIGVKVCSVLDGCPGDAIFAGILYAVDQGADVINMSLGGEFIRKTETGYLGFVHKLFNYARSRGVTIVVSAGNEAIDLDHAGNLYADFCDNPAVICVSATGPTSSDNVYLGPWYDVDAPTTYTNFGRSAIDVAAPGGTAYVGWVRAGCSQFSLIIPVCQTGIYILGVTGTSMAAPHVSGLAAMLVAQYGRDPGTIKELIQDGADDLGQLGTDPFYGKGRINIYNTVVP